MIMAYGNRIHLKSEGRIPPSQPRQRYVDWWPSQTGAYRKLLESIAQAAKTENPHPKLSLPKGFSESRRINFFRSLLEKNVESGCLSADKGVYEMLLRVDHVARADGEKPLVFGSPIWVAEETRPIPGIYLRQHKNGVSESYWDGRQWVGGPNNSVKGEDYTLEPPRITDIIRLQSTDDDASSQPSDVVLPAQPSRLHRIFKR